MSVLGKIVGQLEEGSGNIMNYYYTSGCYTKYELPEGSIFITGYEKTDIPSNYIYTGKMTTGNLEMTINGKTFTSSAPPSDAVLEFENYKVHIIRESGYTVRIYLESDMYIEGTLEITNMKIGDKTFSDETIPFRIFPCDINSNQVISMISARLIMKANGYNA